MKKKKKKKMKIKIEFRANNEGFGCLTHEILYFVRRFLFCLLAGYSARAVFSTVWTRARVSLLTVINTK